MSFSYEGLPLGELRPKAGERVVFSVIRPIRHASRATSPKGGGLTEWHWGIFPLSRRRHALPFKFLFVNSYSVSQNIKKMTCHFSVVLNGKLAGSKTSAENLFSLPICDIMELTKSLSLWERWRRSRRRGLDYGMKLPLTRFAGALPKGEPLDARNLRGMGFALCRRCLQRCNTKAKLAIKGVGNMFSNDMIVAHKFSSNHKEELQKDKLCGCFYCLEIFDPVEIKDWIPDSNGTAECPYCGVDSVIGEHSGFPITKDFLSKMKEYWF